MSDAINGTVQGYTYRQVAKSIDHSLLKPDLTEAQVEEGLQLAARYDVASVSCRPCDIPLAARLLAGTDVRVGSTVGFPHGANTSETKVTEAVQAMENGCYRGRGFRQDQYWLCVFWCESFRLDPDARLGAPDRATESRWWDTHARFHAGGTGCRRDARWRDRDSANSG